MTRQNKAPIPDQVPVRRDLQNPLPHVRLSLCMWKNGLRLHLRQTMVAMRQHCFAVRRTKDTDMHGSCGHRNLNRRSSPFLDWRASCYVEIVIPRGPVGSHRPSLEWRLFLVCGSACAGDVT
jgi:hypothetical protein